MKTHLKNSSPRHHGSACLSVGDLATAAGSIRGSSTRYRAELTQRLRRLLQDSNGDIRQEALPALGRLAA